MWWETGNRAACWEKGPSLSPACRRDEQTHSWDYNSQRAVRERARWFFCRKSALSLGPPTASRAGAAQSPRYRGSWGPDGGRHGNGGALTLGTGGGWVHARILEARLGTDNPPPPLCDGLGQARAPGTGTDQRPGREVLSGGSGRQGAPGVSSLGGIGDQVPREEGCVGETLEVIAEGVEPGRHLARRGLGGEKKLEMGRVVQEEGLLGVWQERGRRVRDLGIEEVSRGRKLALQAKGSVETGAGYC